MNINLSGSGKEGVDTIYWRCLTEWVFGNWLANARTRLLTIASSLKGSATGGRIIYVTDVV